MSKRQFCSNGLILLMLLLLILPGEMNAQGRRANAIGKFAISFNPVGFLQFGPVVNAEFGITPNMVINVHTRFPSLGLLSYVAADHADGLDAYTGFAVGGGLIMFFGRRMHKPYVGAMIDYQTHSTLYAEDADWEWERDNHVIAFIFNGGYRFRFRGGFFINTGAFLGFAVDNWNWEYSDTSAGAWGSADNSDREGTGITPFYMLEVTFGFEF